MEHIAIEIKKDPTSVRMVNYRKEDNSLPKLLPMFKKRIDYVKRQKHISAFNEHNRWKKRGLKLVNMSFPLIYIGNYGALVSVLNGDGSVIVSIGGIEIGQGIYTRMVQVAANEFQIPVEKVSIIPGYTFATPNNYGTGSSITTECSAYAVIRCCQEIKARLEPVRAAMPKSTWQEIVFAANNRGINLQANYLTSQNDPRLVEYPIFGLAATEVEIDVLTGRKWIVRADVFEDAGRSINPALDIGQVEGGFIQSLSSWTMEEIKMNNHTGEVLTDRTWNYKIFGAKDIPHDFRVYLQRNAYNPVGILGSKGTFLLDLCIRSMVSIN
jgi:xanthine dehydrogenase/oxidase